MGHERKRGAIMELCSLIINGDDEPFALITAPLPANIKYCLTLDADTVLPKGELKRLVGAMEHPLNAPANAQRRGKEQIRRINIPLGRGGHIFFACWRILSGCVRNRPFRREGDIQYKLLLFRAVR